MSRWSMVGDEWDPERDPALKRMAEALAPRQPVQDAHHAPEAPALDTEPTRDELESLRDRAAGGDYSARHALRRALDRLRGRHG